MLESVYEVKGQVYHRIVGLPAGEVAEGEVPGEDVALSKPEEGENEGGAITDRVLRCVHAPQQKLLTSEWV